VKLDGAAVDKLTSPVCFFLLVCLKYTVYAFLFSLQSFSHTFPWTYMTKLTYSGKLFVCPKPQSIEEGGGSASAHMHATVAVVASILERKFDCLVSCRCSICHNCEYPY